LDSQTDHLAEIWATELPGLPIEGGGEVFGSIVDLQGRFNINNLVDQAGEADEASLDQFRRARPRIRRPSRGGGRPRARRRGA
jgi:general secretion pathway protein K